MTILSALKDLATGRWPNDSAGLRLRSEATKLADNIDTLAAITDRQVNGATISVGAENTNVRAITIQLVDAAGADINYTAGVLVGVFLDAGAKAFAATGGSTGIAIGTDGALLALVAKKLFLMTSEDDGDIDLTWTDTGTEAAYLGVLLPNGRWVMSAALTNA